MFGFEWSLVKWPDALLLAIDGFDVGGTEGLHDFVTNIFGLQVNQEVVMVGHEAVGENQDEIGYEVVTHFLDEKAPVVFVEEDGLAVDASVVEVVVVTG